MSICKYLLYSVSIIGSVLNCYIYNSITSYIIFNKNLASDYLSFDIFNARNETHLQLMIGNCIYKY